MGKIKLCPLKISLGIFIGLGLIVGFSCAPVSERGGLPMSKLHPWYRENVLPAKRPLPTYECKKVETPPTVDGFIEPDIWGDIPSTGNFWTSVGDRPARFRTEAKLCWTDSHLYIAFQCEDPKIIATRTERDSGVYSEDVVEVFISPWGDPHRYYEIDINPLNTLFDALVENTVDTLGWPDGFRLHPEWNCEGIRTAVHLEGKINDRSGASKGWSAEYAIPFLSLGKTDLNPPKSGALWRMNLYRIEGVPQTDFYAWSPNWAIYPNFHISTGFGWLKFVD